MKKVLAILLTVLMIMSMAACAKTDGTAGTTTCSHQGQRFQTPPTPRLRTPPR